MCLQQQASNSTHNTPIDCVGSLHRSPSVRTGVVCRVWKAEDSIRMLKTKITDWVSWIWKRWKLLRSKQERLLSATHSWIKKLIPWSRRLRLHLQQMTIELLHLPEVVAGRHPSRELNIVCLSLCPSVRGCFSLSLHSIEAWGLYFVLEGPEEGVVALTSFTSLSTRPAFQLDWVRRGTSDLQKCGGFRPAIGCRRGRDQGGHGHRQCFIKENLLMSNRTWCWP
jgi:hypothetical protein